LKEQVKDLEQRIRKHDQEMDSLTFRNEQLTKRIYVLQQELQINSHSKKNKNKHVESTGHVVDFGVLDEELHKKILQNAELVSTMADKDQEIENSKDRIEWLEQKICHLQKELHDSEDRHTKAIEKLRKRAVVTTSETPEPLSLNVQEISLTNCVNEQGQGEMCNFWQQEAERWRTECELLRAKPETNEHLTEYYESQIRELLESKQTAQSEAGSLWAENTALSARLEQVILEKNHLENSILTNVEDLHTTSDNYKSQLDAMTEHLAAQNEKITKQCDEIQVLKHRLSLKK